MKALKLGSAGAAVRRWQQYLRGLGYLILADGKFALSTKLATLDFQARHGLRTDGIVGNATYGTAMADGFEVVPPGGKDKTSPAWPKPPARLRSITSVERKQQFGSFKFELAPQKKNPEAIKITERLAGFKIVTLNLPQLVGVRGFPRSGNIFVHEAAAAPLVGLIGDWEAASLLNRIASWGGSWVPRFIRGSKTQLSNHAWGTAFDINANQNGLGKRPAVVGDEGSVRELVPLANKHGFYWGGHFSSRPDGMHFELGMKL